MSTNKNIWYFLFKKNRWNSLKILSSMIDLIKVEYLVHTFAEYFWLEFSRLVYIRLIECNILAINEYSGEPKCSGFDGIF